MKLRFLKRLKSAARSYRSGEPSYKLDISSAGGFDLVRRRGTADDKVLRSSFENDEFFAAVPDYLPRPSDVIVDVGGHIGTFAMLAACKVPKGAVHAVEASQETFNLLRINTVLNGLNNVTCYRYAVAGKDGEAKLYFDTGNLGHSTMRAYSSQFEVAPAISLETFFEASGIERCHFMKLNCEGAEFPFLIDAPDEALSRIDRMLVLYHCDLARGYSDTDLISRLSNAGFDIEVQRKKRKRGWVVARRKGLAEATS